MDVLVTYDITDTETIGASRLKRIANVCEKHGQQVQFSVFVCCPSKTRLARFIGEVEDTSDRDSVFVCMCPRGIEAATLRLGRSSERILGEPWIP